ncbi:MAG: hypothetical protein A2146_03315 [Actinobacteria bacterium RBG_16_67_10]|nr:MAG: hypothetical protein A2146_03315 [Actinobacteria bacterium RBG_16_67_10]
MWRAWRPGHNALIVVRETPAGARISGAIKGLKAGTEYRIIGTNEDGACSAPVTSANRTFTLGVMGNTTANGTFFDVPVDGTLWPSTSFMRIREVGGAVWACMPSHSFIGGTNVANGAFSRFIDNGELKAIVVVERRPNDQARVFVAAGDVNNDLRVTGTSMACGSSGGALFKALVSNEIFSVFASRMVDMSQADLDALRSIRIRSLTGQQGQDWPGACRKSILIELLVE